MSANTGHRSENDARHRLGGLVALLEARGILRSVLPGGGASIAGVAVGSVTHDSRRAAPGSLFVAVTGQNDDGHMYALAAVQAGAVGVIAERAIPSVAVPQLMVHAARPALALAAAWVHDFPSRELGVVGITGTDGKTTTAHLVRALLGACAGPTGMVGTIDVVVGGRSLGNTGRATTPEAPELQAHLAGMVAAGDRFAVVEATSHGLAQDRAAEIDWDVAVLTNIGHEHLEFHRTHEAYRAAKRRLFESLARPSGSDVNRKGGKGVATAVVNRDDAAADGFLDAARAAGAKLLTYGTDPRGSADIRATSVHEDATGLTITVATPTWRDTVALPLAGRFNVHNALAAIGVAEAFGIDPACIRAALATVEPVPGRMERIDQGQPFVVIVDYAHTPEALETVLDGLAPLAAASGGGLIAVFGSAGDRDVMKRPMMGRIAGERCRLVVITDEDPRSEDRDAILEAIAEGAEAVGRRRDQDLLLIADRDAAIHRAIELARPGDVVVLCGKGHERTIEMRDGPVPWDEAEVARSALAGAGHVGPAPSGRG